VTPVRTGAAAKTTGTRSTRPVSPAAEARQASAEATRRHLSARQAAVVARLVDAAAVEAREHGYEGLTVRKAAKRAAVAPATAYTYFASKDHLLAEVMWRRLHAATVADPNGATAIDRVTAVLQDLGLLMADDPALAAACTTALLGPGPDVRRLRDRLGAHIHTRLALALGDDEDPVVLRTLELAYIGAMLSAGMGHGSFAEVPADLRDVAHLILDTGTEARVASATP